MTLTLSLPKDIEQRLTEASRRQGVSVDEFTLKLLRQHLPAADRREKLKKLLRSWIDDGDVAEQQDTFDFLAHALDEDRPSDRKLFPAELKGVTW